MARRRYLKRRRGHSPLWVMLDRKRDVWFRIALSLVGGDTFALIRSKSKTIPTVRPNAGHEAMYNKRLDEQISLMHRDIERWAKREYAEHTPRIAMDRTPAEVLSSSFTKLMRKWQSRFDDLSANMAKHFALPILQRHDRVMMGYLKKAGFAVKFDMTPTMRDAYKAVIGENVGLIRSIPQEHLSKVQGMVFRSVQQGRDLSVLSHELQKRYNLTRSRAAFIARDQNNKATAVFTRVRQQEIGADKAVWLHSHGGRHPRPEHVAFSGQEYDIRQGAFLEGVWTWPGVQPNCRCVSKTVISGFS